MKKMTAREYLTKYPNASVKEAAKVIGVKVGSVYAARYKLRKDIVGGAVFTSPPKRRGRPPKAKLIDPASNKSVVDLVNHPPHYKVGGIETIDFIEAKKLNYNIGNVVKYITRADHKGNRKQDLEKARWYLDREIKALT